MEKTILVVLIGILTLTACNERREINTNKKFKVYNCVFGKPNGENVVWCDEVLSVSPNRVEVIIGSDTSVLISDRLYTVEENPNYIPR